MARTGLTHLAHELIMEICAHVASEFNTSPAEIKSDLSNLRLVCKQLRYAPEPYLFLDITLDAPKKRRLSYLTDAQLSELQTNETPVSHYARILRIRLTEDAERQQGWSRIRMPGQNDNFLKPTILSLKHLRSVEWDVQVADPCSNIINILTMLPELTTMILNFCAVPWHEFPLHKMVNLRKLAIFNIEDSPFADVMLQQVSQLMLLSPTLTNIAIDVDPCLWSRNRFPFPVFPKTEEGTVSCPLKYLRLRGCGFKFKSRPQLTALTSLEIEHMHCPANANIWTLLKDSTYLKSIITDAIPPSLLSYLQSYSGMEKFTFVAPKDRWAPSTVNDDLEETFYTSILPLHKDTITSLSLHMLSPTNWSINDPFTSSLLLCHNLVNLSIDIHIVELGKNNANLNELLSTMLQFPRLRFLAINHTFDAILVWALERGIMEFLLPTYNVFKIFMDKNLFTARSRGQGYKWRPSPVKPVTDVAVRLGWVLG